VSVAGSRLSEGLSSSPLPATHDNGTAWTPGLLGAALADVPDALAASPSGGRLLALLASGQVQLSGPGGTGWARLATRRALAASPAGGQCGLGSLTAAAFSPSGVPLLAASCTHPGPCIFAYTAGAWHLAGPPPATYAHPGHQRPSAHLPWHHHGTAGGRHGSGAQLLAAWSTGDSGARWALSRPLPLNGTKPTSVSSGPGGAVAVVLTGNHAKTITGPAGEWRPLPALPPGTATLAPGPGGGWDALAVHSTRLTVWQLTPGHAAWASTQTISVFIQFGSSG
jgi:hypothetical protein